ncbi:hypothetical protein GPECTOR_18g61 [Gonium pectorale]|uniref:FAS1 domain-containing protein n=1 Tax=Gonium pectorale TaxID=33097 RepID=A0A150GJZ5_GONPE|nr:hypothetical protein GPECTOR_18g61 [Gonium pectorale]|eukprot:KXZ50084.1 hypothetical protein GPECTOR_18g61 [Gonium pectorale]
MNIRLLISGVLLLGAFVRAAVNGSAAIPAPCLEVASARSLSELAAACPELSTVRQLLEQASQYEKWLLDCRQKCSRPSELQRTVFLPIDTAWAAYFAATGLSAEQLLLRRSRAALSALMRYHVLPRALTSEAVPLVAGAAAAKSSSTGTAGDGGTGGSGSGSGAGGGGSSGGGMVAATLQGGSLYMERLERP